RARAVSSEQEGGPEAGLLPLSAEMEMVGRVAFAHEEMTSRVASGFGGGWQSGFDRRYDMVHRRCAVCGGQGDYYVKAWMPEKDRREGRRGNVFFLASFQPEASRDLETAEDAVMLMARFSKVDVCGECWSGWLESMARFNRDYRRKVEALLARHQWFNKMVGVVQAEMKRHRLVQELLKKEGLW